VRCAGEIQRAWPTAIGSQLGAPLRFRIGVNLGDVIADGGDIYATASTRRRAGGVAGPEASASRALSATPIATGLPYASRTGVSRASRTSRGRAGLCVADRNGSCSAGPDGRCGLWRHGRTIMGRRRAGVVHRLHWVVVLARRRLSSPSGASRPDQATASARRLPRLPVGRGSNDRDRSAEPKQ